MDLHAGITPGDLGRPYEMPGIEFKPVMYRTGDLPAVLSLVQSNHLNLII